MQQAAGNERVSAFTGQLAADGRRQIALTIAGFDPSCGAGVTADLKVFAAHRLYGMACLTALTVQSTLGVRRVEPIAAEIVRETLRCLREDVHFAAVKIGMLAVPEVAREVAHFLAEAGQPREGVVLDPVLRSSSGRALLDMAGLQELKSSLLAQVGWITPNTEELALLTGTECSRRDEIPKAAAILQQQAAALGNPELNVVVTGGHLEKPDDFLRTASGEELWVPGEWVDTTSTHGTGCAYSSALASRLALGDGDAGAVKAAKTYVEAALRAAYPVGHGRGPMDHLF